MKLEAVLEERVSKKGNKYKCIVVRITDNVEKIIFLNPVDVELINLKYGKNN